jgi:SCY1-like protein 2
VEEEHAKHLRDVRRIEQQTNTYQNTETNSFGMIGNGNGNGEMDFESLVKGGSGTSPVPPSSGNMGLDPWDEGWTDSSVHGLVRVPKLLQVVD